MKTDNITRPDGTRLRLNAWHSDAAKASIIFCHGFQEHSARYSYEAAFFNKNGYNFLGFDMRGHGASDGQPRAYVNNFKDLIEDFRQVYTHYRTENDLPVFIFGHSLGGLVTTSFLIAHNNIQQEIRGLMLSAPLLLPNADMAPILQKISGLVSAVMPKLRTVKLDPNALSRDDSVVEAYINDPLVVHSGIHARTGYVFLRKMDDLQSNAAKLKLPFIIQHGKEDSLAEHEGSKMLFENADSSDKVFISLDESKHEITRDLDKEQVLDDYLSWMEKRL